MSGTNIRVADLPDLGVITDTSIIVADKAGSTGKFTALTLKNYVAITTLPEAPSTNSPYGRQNGAWVSVLPEAPSNGISYGRLNGGWSPVIPPAPADGLAYGRMNSAWTQVLPTTGGSIGGTLNVTGNIGTGGGVYANQFALSSSNGYEWGFSVLAGSGDHIQQHRAGWAEIWTSTGGIRAWTAPAGNLMVLDGSGNLGAVGRIRGNNIYATSDDSFGMYVGGAGRVIQFATNFYWDWNSGNGTVNFFAGGYGLFWSMRTTDWMCFNALGPVGGMGAYYNGSDERLKEQVQPAAAGLDAILQIQPITFVRKRKDDAPPASTELGFSAQNVQQALPLAVAERESFDGDGTMLGVMSESIVAALVNAVKTLTARVAELEGRAG